MAEKSKLAEAYNNLRWEYFTTVKKALDTTIVNKDISLLKSLIEGLEDIHKNGGAYSSAKAVELLHLLGELK